MILGIDTASVAGNKNTDWVRAKAGGINFAIIRGAWGTVADKDFAKSWPLIKAAGIVRGAYLFLRMDQDSVKQVQAFFNVVGKLEPGDLPPSLDVEFPDNKKDTKGRHGCVSWDLTPAEAMARLMAAYTEMARLFECLPIVYTSGRVWKEDLANMPAPDMIRSPLWLARYPYKSGAAVLNPSPSMLAPPVPPPWGDADNWWVHQFQGDATGCPGFPSGNVDLNRFNPLCPGDKGARVEWMQAKLNIPLTGKFDKATADNVRAFQTSKGLVADGLVGPKTFAFLARV
jgi:lysozyme